MFGWPDAAPCGSRVTEPKDFFTAPVAYRLHLKKPTSTGFFTPAASRWRMIIGYGRVSTTEQNLGLRHDDVKPAFDASLDVTDARWGDSASFRSQA